MTKDEANLIYKPQEKASFLHDSTCSDIIVPAKFDVLCGRDHESLSHEGNIRFRAIVAMNCERYQSAKTRDDKYIITDEIINATGGYFLRKDPKTNMWHNVGQHYAHEKVAHALRSAKDPNKKCPRKMSTIVHKDRIKEENPVYDTLLAEQQYIFRELLEKEES